MASKKRRSPIRAPRRGERRKKLWWDALPAQELLDVRLCDLDLALPGTALESRIAQLYEELRRAGLRYRPHVWLSTDWMTPDGVGGFAVPFYLAHSRLMRLEHAKMLEVEGGTKAWCMKLLRHEAGHAIDNAYRLHWTKQWRETFGRFSDPYSTDYAPDPESRNFVLHLGFWYSQSHPAEDYAESFAEWVRPGGRWRTRYKDWPVRKKLESLDGMMARIAEQKPKVTTRARPEALRTLKFTLRDYYEEKQQHYEDALPKVVDDHLYRLFGRPHGTGHHGTGHQGSGHHGSGHQGSGHHGSGGRRESAARFLRRFRTAIRNRVANITRQPKYLVEQAIHVVIVRCRELDLRLIQTAEESHIDAAILITIMTMRFVHDKRDRYRR